MVELIIGGAASGKSELAENLLVKLVAKAPRLYIATMIIRDEESEKKVERHKRLRQVKGFTTIECPTGLAKTELQGGENILLECLTNLLANEMYQPSGAGIRAVEEIFEGIKTLAEGSENLVVVTGNVFEDGKKYDDFTTEYMKNLGELNCKIGQMADVVVEVVCGIPIWLKGGSYALG